MILFEERPVIIDREARKLPIISLTEVVATHGNALRTSQIRVVVVRALRINTVIKLKSKL